MARNLSFPPSVKPGIPRLGETPKGWSRVAFGDVLHVVERPANLDEDAEYQLIVARRNRGGIAPRERLTGREILTKSQFFVHAGDFIISKRQIVHGACGIVPPSLDGSVVSNEYAVLHAKNGLNLKFLEYFTHSLYFQQTCFHASVGVAVEKMIFRLDEWLRHEFDLPPMSVQERVVAVLSTWDRTIKGVRKLSQAKRRLKLGLAQRLLTGDRRLPGFKQPWTKHGFGNIASPSRRRCNAATAKPGVRCVELEHISQGDGRLLGTVDAQEQRSVKASFDEGDVLFGKLRPNLRKSYLCDFSGLCSTEIWVLQPNKSVCCSDYLAQLVQSHRFIAAACVTAGSKMPRAEWSYVSEVPFRLPPLDEQRKIARVLESIDREIALLERKLSLLIEQKKGLMQNLFAGHVPTKD